MFLHARRQNQKFLTLVLLRNLHVHFSRCFIRIRVPDLMFSRMNRTVYRELIEHDTDQVSSASQMHTMRSKVVSTQILDTV